MNQPLKVLVVDDQPLVRQGFMLVLSGEDDLSVVGEAADGKEALERARQKDIDVIVMDVQMPCMDGIEATRRIVSENLAKVLILTTFDQDDYIFDALDAGASGFLLKNAEPEKLLEAIRVVGWGHALLSPEVTARVIAHRLSEQSAQPRKARELTQLTEREKDVLVLVARGMSNAEIADALVLGESTVKTHVSNVLTKLGLRDRVQAVGFAYESGLLRVGEDGFHSYD